MRPTTCSPLLKVTFPLIAFGIILTAICHFFIACVTPMTYKLALLSGATPELANRFASSWTVYITPLKLFIMIVIILIQSIFMMTLIIKQKIKCPKWMVLLNPLVLTILYIPVYYHWNHHN